MNHHVAEHRSVGRPWQSAAWVRWAAMALVTALPATLYAQPATTTAPATRPVIARGVNVPPSLRIAANLTPTQQEQVRKFVAAEVAAMAGGDPAIQSAARRNLVLSSHVLQQNKPVPASPIYQQLYSTTLNTTLLSQLKHPDARIRLNAAVTLTQVAFFMNQGTTLQKAVLATLSDTSEPVVLWGVRAARQIYPYLLDTDKAQATEVASAVLQAMFRYPKQTPLVADAFGALAGKEVTGSASRAGAGMNDIIRLIQTRALTYARVGPGALPETDPSFPARVDLDAPVITYLATTGWRSMNPTQKALTGRAVVDMAEQLVRLAPLLPARVAGDTEPRLEDLMTELRFVTRALEVMGGAAAPAVVKAAQNLNKLANNQPAQPLMEAEIANLQAAMAAANLFAPRPAPPADPAANAAAGPAGKPATRPGGRPTTQPGVRPLRPPTTRPATRPAAPAGARPARPATTPAGARPAPGRPAPALNK